MVVRNLPHPPARVGSKFGKEPLVGDVTSPFDIAVSSLCTEFDIPNFAFAHSKIERFHILLFHILFRTLLVLVTHRKLPMEAPNSLYHKMG